MNVNVEPEIVSSTMDPEQNMRMMEKFFTAIQPTAVFGEPVTNGEYTVITAREIGGGLGFGFGRGFGPAAAGQDVGTVAGGTGVGGGGASTGRPVAIIVIGPKGVNVQPVVDVTKIALRGIFVSRIFLKVVSALLRKKS